MRGNVLNGMHSKWKLPKNFKGLFVSSVVLSVALNACAHAYDRTVAHVDRDRFMGSWYVMAGRFTFLEKDVFNSVEKYTWNEAEQRIDIDFSYRKGSLTGELKKYPQKGFIQNHETNATWKVSPFWPLKFTYLIIALDPDYEWTAIGVPNQHYLWIMAKSPMISKTKIREAIETVRSLNYSVEDIVYVEHEAIK